MLGRVCHGLRNSCLWNVCAVHGWTSGWTFGEGDLRPVGTIVKHEVFLNDLTLRMEVCSSIHRVLDTQVDGYDVGGNAFVRVGLCVMDDPECWVGRRTGGVREFGWEKTITTTRVGCKLFSRSIAGLVLVHLESLEAVRNEPRSIAQM